MTTNDESDPSSCYTIVLTGASGYLGQHCLEGFLNAPSLGPRNVVIHALQQRSHTPFSQAIQLYQEKKHQGRHGEETKRHVTVVTHALDLTSADACREWLTTVTRRATTTTTQSTPCVIDCCIHAAALSSPSVCEQEPDRAQAVNVPTHWFDLLWQHNPKIYILALSTDQVYGGDLGASSRHSSSSSEAHLYTEESIPRPVNVYGRTKVALEDYLLQGRTERYPQSTVVILRSSIMIGPLAPFSSAHDTFVHFVHHRATTSTLTTYFTNEIRSVIAVSDVVTILMRLVLAAQMQEQLGAGASEVFCMGGPDPVSRHDMAVAVLHHLALPVDQYATPAVKDTTQGSDSVQSPLNIAMDSSKLYRTIGLSAPQTLAKIVASTFPQTSNVV